MGKSLADQANEEFIKSCQEREGYEMVNSDAGDLRTGIGPKGQDEFDDTVSHKPITRGSQHRR